MSDRINASLAQGDGTNRLTPQAWQLLQRLEQDGAAIVFCEESGRFHFWLHDRYVDVVRDSTVQALRSAVAVQATRGATPTLLLSERGRTLLRRRLGRDEFAPEAAIARPMLVAQQR